MIAVPRGQAFRFGEYALRTGPPRLMSRCICWANQAGVVTRGATQSILLLPVIGTIVPGDLGGAIQDAIVGVGGHQGERPAYRLGRDAAQSDFPAGTATGFPLNFPLRRGTPR
jgi:hypothetical protein